MSRNRYVGKLLDDCNPLFWKKWKNNKKCKIKITIDALNSYMANQLINNFGSLIILKTKELLNDFVWKYEKLTIKNIGESHWKIENYNSDFIIDDIDKVVRSLHVKRAVDRDD
jgi:hypothetical protein